MFTFNRSIYVNMFPHKQNETKNYCISYCYYVLRNFKWINVTYLTIYTDSSCQLHSWLVYNRINYKNKALFRKMVNSTYCKLKSWSKLTLNTLALLSKQEDVWDRLIIRRISYKSIRTYWWVFADLIYKLISWKLVTTRPFGKS